MSNHSCASAFRSSDSALLDTDSSAWYAASPYTFAHAYKHTAFLKTENMCHVTVSWGAPPYTCHICDAIAFLAWSSGSPSPLTILTNSTTTVHGLHNVSCFTPPTSAEVGVGGWGRGTLRYQDRLSSSYGAVRHFRPLLSPIVWYRNPFIQQFCMRVTFPQAISPSRCTQQSSSASRVALMRALAYGALREVDYMLFY